MDAIDLLFAEIENNPDDDAAYSILADALQERADPRGELANVQQALAVAPKSERDRLLVREKALIHAARTRLVGAKLVAYPGIEIGFRLGFAERLSLTNLTTAQIVAALVTAFRSPDTRLLRSLVIASEDEDATDRQIRNVLRELAAEKLAPPRSLRRLRLGNAFELDPDDRMVAEQDDQPRDDLSGVLAAFPNLVDLQVDLGVVAVMWSPLVSKTLERFAWIAPRITKSQLEPLAASVLPALTTFTLWVGATYQAGFTDDGEDDDETEDDEEVDGDGNRLVRLGGVTPRGLHSILEMLDRQMALRELGLPHFGSSISGLVDVLQNHSLIQRIETLDLSHCELSESDADEVGDLLLARPNIKRLRIDGVTAPESVRRQLTRRLGARLGGEWADTPTQFRYLTRGE